jgi:class 3 adenylate cyclase
MQMAAAGEVLVCGPVFERIRHLLSGHRVDGRGDVALRGRSEPIPVYAVQAAAEASA